MTDQPTTTIRAWRVTDEDTVAAATWAEAVDWHHRELGIDYGLDADSYPDQPRETPRDVRIAVDGPKGDETTTVGDELDAIMRNGEHTPMLLCSTEY